MRIAPRLATGVALAALAAIPLATASAADKYLIVPGQSIGPVKIGSTQIQVSRAWGAPARKAGKGMVSTWRWGTGMPLNHPKVVIFMGTAKGSPTAATISTGDMLFHTAAGITPRQSSSDDVMAAYPTATCDLTAGTCTLAGPAGRNTVFSLTDGDTPGGPMLVLEITVSKSGA